MSRLLFITRKYPPSVGGMELYAVRLEEQLGAHRPLKTLALTRSQIHLVWFGPYSLARGLWVAHTTGTTHIHVGDVVLAPIGVILRWLTSARVSITAYGLDVVHPPFWYQRIVKWALPKLDVVIAISEATRQECLMRGVPSERCHVVVCGTDLHPETPPDRRLEARAELRGRLGLELDGDPVIVSLGRHVERKGFRWLVAEVADRLPKSATIVIAGDGPGRPGVASTVEAMGLGERIRLTGMVSNGTKELLLQAADVFAMPNRSIAGDMEGFGLVALEATAYGTPVVACGIEGIRDAVVDGVTGRLVPEDEPYIFARALVEVAEWDRSLVKQETEERYSWERMYSGYASALGFSREE